jgi:uncharacterized iron-regulated membrane protein
MLPEEEKDKTAPKAQKRGRVRIPRVVRNTLISVFVLLFLLVGSGVAYTYYMGQQTSPNVAAATATEPVATVDPVIKPTKPAANASESAAIEMLTSPVSINSNASVTVKTLAGSACSISVVYGTVVSADSGLTAKIADEFGTVTWSWTVGPTVPVGTWPVKINCVHNSRSAFVQGDLVVTKQ